MNFEVIIPFLKPIEAFLESTSISEIMVNPDGTVWTEERGQIRRHSGIQFEDGALQTGLEVIANRFGKKLDADSPILNLRLPDGSRMAAMIPPVVNPRPLVTIRKFTSRNFVVADLIRVGMLNEEQAITLTKAVREGQNILIAGSTGSGKSTLLGVLADAIPEHERILLIEDTAELHIRKPHIVSTELQVGTHRSQVTFDDLLKAVLRHRPDRIIVGEVRGSEARTLLDAMNTGHRGTITTIHANGTEEALHRLTALAMRAGAASDMNIVRAEVKRCIDIVIHIERQNGKRRVSQIAELLHDS